MTNIYLNQINSNEINRFNIQSIEIILSVITLMSGLFCLITSIFVIIIHLKNEIFRQGFFKVVFSMVIIESIMNLTIFVNSAIFLRDIIKANSNHNNRKIIKSIFSFIFDFCLISILMYNIIIVFYLYNSSNPKLESNTNTSEIELSISEVSEFHVNIKEYSFSSFHIFSIIIGIIHSIVLIATKKSGDLLGIIYYIKFYNYESTRCNKKNSLIFLFFIPQFLFIILIIIYLSLTKIKETHDNFIKIRSYNIYLLIISFSVIIFPFSMAIITIKDNIKEFNNNKSFKIYGNISKCLSNICILVFIYTSCIYRFSCYYIQISIGGINDSLCIKIYKVICILFGYENLSETNFVDFSSNYLMHSLTTLHDFSSISHIGNEIESLGKIASFSKREENLLQNSLKNNL